MQCIALRSFAKKVKEGGHARILGFFFISEMYSIQHYVIKFVSDLQQIGNFLWVLRFPPSIKLTVMI